MCGLYIVWNSADVFRFVKAMCRKGTSSVDHVVVDALSCRIGPRLCNTYPLKHIYARLTWTSPLEAVRYSGAAAVSLACLINFCRRDLTVVLPLSL